MPRYALPVRSDINPHQVTEADLLSFLPSKQTRLPSVSIASQLRQTSIWIKPPPIPKSQLIKPPIIMSTSVVPAVRANSASPTSTSSRKASKSSATSATATMSSSSRPSTRSSTDPYYGHEETAVLCARFITSLFQCPNIPTPTHANAATPTLAHFVAYALHRTRLPPIVTFAALLLLQRLKVRFPAARGSSGHRLFVSAFMISSKVICDDTYSNQSWGIVAQKMFQLKEINQMEREMCGYLEWNLNVHGDEVQELEARVRAEHGPRAVVRASSSSSLFNGDSVLAPAPSHSYPTPDTTPDPSVSSRPIRPVPSPYKNKSSYHMQAASVPPSPPSSPNHYLHAHSPRLPHFSSQPSSLQSSPASDDCKTPSPVAVTAAGSSGQQRISSKVDHLHGRARQHANVGMSGSGYAIGAW